jgi:sirohydrochlorin ferrochelatase
MKTAIIVLGHGSKRQESGAPVTELTTALKSAGCFEIVEHAFLQYAAPTIEDAVGSCRRQGAGKIVIVPFFVQPGAHVMKDIPDKLEKLKRCYPNVVFTVTDYVGAHPMMLDIVADLARKC